MPVPFLILTVPVVLSSIFVGKKILPKAEELAEDLKQDDISDAERDEKIKQFALDAFKLPFSQTREFLESTGRNVVSIGQRFLLPLTIVVVFSTLVIAYVALRR